MGGIVSKRHFRVCAQGHAVYDDSAVTCPRCGVPLRRRGDGGLARLVRGTRSASQWALSIGVLILALGLLAVTYRLSAPLRAEIVAIVARRSAELPASVRRLAQGVGPTLTPSPLVTPAPRATTPVASPTPTPSPPTPTPTLACELRVAYVADLTIPDGTVVKPGETVTKSWRVRNSGTCAWPDGVLLQPVVNNKPEIGPGLAVAPLDAGAEGDLSLEVQAPAAAGEVTYVWALCYGETCAPAQLTMVAVVQE